MTSTNSNLLSFDSGKDAQYAYNLTRSTLKGAAVAGVAGSAIYASSQPSQAAGEVEAMVTSLATVGTGVVLIVVTLMGFFFGMKIVKKYFAAG